MTRKGDSMQDTCYPQQERSLKGDNFHCQQPERKKKDKLSALEN